MSTPAAPDSPDPSAPGPTPAQEASTSGKTFADLGLAKNVLKGIQEHGFEVPTDIQAELIPRVLNGQDCLGQAKTGTGKTAAFGLPMLSMLRPEDGAAQALVLGPTRELAVQIAAELAELARYTDLGVTSIIGGESMRAQNKSLQEGGHIVVGTPGRVLDLQGRRQLSFDNIRFAVLDEVDRMLDIGFRDDIKKVLSKLKRDHQTIFVSATMDKSIESLSRQFMNDTAEKVNVVSGSLTVSRVVQHYLAVEPWDKRSLLLKMLRTEKPDTTIVFCRTKHTVRKVTTYLRDKGIGVREIHGDMAQPKRTKVMNAMRRGDVDVLVASDLAARGLDVDHITHVINYDIPEDPEIYIHRIGRTARAGRKGVAWSFVMPDQGQMLTEIEKLTGVLIEKLDYPDFKPGRVPDDIRQQRELDAKRKTGGTTPADRVISGNTKASEDTGMSDEELKRMFPDGKVPKNLPKRGLGSKFKRRGR